MRADERKGSAGARLTRVSMRLREHLSAFWYHDLVPDLPQQDPTPTPTRHRKRLRRRESMNSPRFLTFSCYRQLQLFGTPALRGVFVEALRRAWERETFDLIAWVIMPEHVHLMVRPRPGVKWATIAAGLKTSVGKLILNKWKKAGARILTRLYDARGDLHFWQPGGGFDRNVRNDGELEKEIRYIHRNPVVRELVEKPTDWEWSSARFWAARFEGREPEPNDLWCDWPPGDTRAWAMWSGFL